MNRSVLFSLFAFGVAATNARADVPDIAELFPAGTLAYAEVRNPADAARVVAGWVKGTPFENGLNLVQDRQDAIKDLQGVVAQQPVGIATLLTSPEFLNEIGRFGGAAVGLTGFTDKHEPQFVTVVLFGESTAGGLLARGFLTTSRSLRRVDTVDGVPILQHRAFPPPAFGEDGKPLPFENPKPTVRASETTYTYRPGLLVVGSHAAAVADVVRRFGRKQPGPSLAGQKTFSRLAQERKQPGIFFHAVPPALVKELMAVRKANQDAIDGDALALLNFVANPAAFPAIFGNLTLGPDDITLMLKADIAPGQPSPLLALLAGSGSPRWSAAAQADVAAAVTLALPPTAERTRAVLAFWDACEKARGELGPLPSERLPDAERRAGVNIRDGLLRRLTAVTVVVPARQELPKEVPQLPLLVCHTDTEGDTNALAEAVPKLMQLATGSEVILQPTSESIQGHRILSLPVSRSLGVPAIHYVKSGTRLVLGLDRKWVARLAAGGGKDTTAIPSESTLRAGVLGRFRPGALARLASTAPAAKPTSPSGVVSLADVIDPLPPILLQVNQDANALSASVSLRGFRSTLPAFTGKLITWLERIGAEAGSSDGETIPRIPFDR